MIYIPNEEEDEPAMRYEGLVMYAFDCDRLDDPNAIADASIFDGEFIPKITEEGVRIMNIVLDKLIEKHPNKLLELKAVKESININLEQENNIDVIDYITNILKY